MLDYPSVALRTGSQETLRAGLMRHMVEQGAEFARDWRDMMIVLAPAHDCALRLGMDVVALFDEGARAGPESLVEVVRAFGRREITLADFGFAIEDSPEGPRYVRID